MLGVRWCLYIEKGSGPFIVSLQRRKVLDCFELSLVLVCFVFLSRDLATLSGTFHQLTWLSLGCNLSVRWDKECDKTDGCVMEADSVPVSGPALRMSVAAAWDKVAAALVS